MKIIPPDINIIPASGNRAVVGVDPGASGAAVVIAPLHGQVEICKFSERNDYYAWRWMKWEAMTWGVPLGFLEGVASRPADSKQNIFVFGGNYRAAKMYMELAGIPYEIIPTPKTWQYEFRLGGKQGALGCTPAQEKTARKNAHKAVAQKLFPEIKVTLEICDALLIAEYGWRKANGRLTGGKR